jgi:hypothetical protein
MKIVISLAAQEDLLAGHQFYEQQAEGIGDYFLDSLFADIDSLLLYAGIHPQINGYSACSPNGFPLPFITRLSAASYESAECWIVEPIQPDLATSSSSPVASQNSSPDPDAPCFDIANCNIKTWSNPYSEIRRTRSNTF